MPSYYLKLDLVKVLKSDPNWAGWIKLNTYNLGTIYPNSTGGPGRSYTNLSATTDVAYVRPDDLIRLMERPWILEQPALFDYVPNKDGRALTLKKPVVKDVVLSGSTINFTIAFGAYEVVPARK